MIDLRSDTFTKPGPGMLLAMQKAVVGDDVFGEDPTVNALESKMAALFGMEAGLFCPSGTMTNQIAIKVHTQPGNEIICEQSSHVFVYEGGGIAFNSGCQTRTIVGDRGKIMPHQVEATINNEDIHKPRTRLVVVENTANRGGGSCYAVTELAAIKKVCDNNQLIFHLDGARLFNAIVANKESPLQYGSLFHSISVCFSKGLGAPVGSILLGDSNFIREARRIRKVLGGGMRQAGYVAAAALYAVENNVIRLAEDHHHAKLLGATLMKKPFIGKILPVETNIIIFEVTGEYTPSTFCALLKKYDILCLAISATQVRMVVHLDISASMIEEVIELIDNL